MTNESIIIKNKIKTQHPQDFFFTQEKEEVILP
jgi:hypothetical protein